MDQLNQTSQENQGPSGAPSSKLLSTIDRVRTQQAPFGNPIKPGFPIFHRVRNEAMEKELSDNPWCGAEQRQGTDHVTILNCDVTCPDCQVIVERQGHPNKGLPITHFDGGKGETLCGERQVGVAMVTTLQETNCPYCQNAAEELLVGIVLDNPPGPDRMDNALAAASKLVGVLTETGGHNEKIAQAWQENNEALRDIAETLKAINIRLKIERDEQGNASIV